MFGNTEETKTIREELKSVKAELKGVKSENKKLNEDVDKLNRKIVIAKEDAELEARRTKTQHEFELVHFKDDEVETLRKQNTELTKKLAVTENENKMLGKIVDVNKDIIDVKNLVNTLIEKLPTININSLMAAPSKE
jgi:predicted RNase H-like nuclease (RuvC/YqgF family)